MYIKKRLKIEDLLIRYSKNLLIANYTHIGFKSRLLHQNFRKAVVGEYNNIAIINTSLTLSTLRYQSRFLLNLAISNQKICFSAFELPLTTRKSLDFTSHYYLINNWPSGIISNFKLVSRSEKLRKKTNFVPYLPAAVWVLGREPDKLLSIVDEASSLLIPTFTINDSTTNLSLLPYWVPSNTKSAFSIFFYLTYVQKLLKKARLVRRHFFLKKTLTSMTKKIERRSIKTTLGWKTRKQNRIRAKSYLDMGGDFDLLSDYNKFILTGWNHLHYAVKKKND